MSRATTHLVRCRAALALAVVLAGLLIPAVARASLAGASDGNLAAFSGGISTSGGTLRTVPTPSRTDRRAFAATYLGSGIGAVSGSLPVSWMPGQSVAWGAAFRLTRSSSSPTSGEEELVGWQGVGAQEGVVFDYGDNQAYLVADPGSALEQVLVGPFHLPIGRWFTVQVRQLLGSAPSSSSRVYVGGRLVGSSSATTLAAGQVSQVSYGIVETTTPADPGQQLSVQFDQALAAGYSGYLDPLGHDHYHLGRTDMGVDFCLRRGAPIRALGDGVVIGISPDWWYGQPYIWYQLLDGPDAGRYVYVAEQIDRLAKVGALLSAGQPIAYYMRSGTCIETGWSAADGATLAQATTGYHEGQVTRAGVAFARFLRSLGVAGRFELRPTHGARRAVPAGRGDR